METHLKGQGATEYLVLLAVVLIIALVSIALLGFFPGLASDARITQSNSYWRGEARPFAIVEHAFTTSGSGTVVLQNVDASGTFTLVNLTVANTTTNISAQVGPGDTRSVSVSGLGTGTAGAIYDLNITIAYTSPQGLSNKQYGSKGIVGKYS